MTDSVFGFVGKDYTMIVADRGQARSIQVLKSDQDKSFRLDKNKLLVCSGDAGDRDQFCEYIQKNVHLNRLRSGFSMSTHATASMIRNELATALRRGPYNVNLLLAGFEEDRTPSSSSASSSSSSASASSSTVTDDDTPQAAASSGSPSLWFIDYLASAKQLDYAVHGHAQYFLSSVLDRHYRKGLSVAEGFELVRLCIKEIGDRYLIKHRSFLVRWVDASGNESEEIFSA